MSKTVRVNQFTRDHELEDLVGATALLVRTESVYSFSSFMPPTGNKISEITRPGPCAAGVWFEDGSYFLLNNGTIDYVKEGEDDE